MSTSSSRPWRTIGMPAAISVMRAPRSGSIRSSARTGAEKGAGGRALQALIEEADRQGALIRLYVDYAEERLFGYYAQFGFEHDPAGGEIMERLPKEKPTPKHEAGLRRSKP